MSKAGLSTGHGRMIFPAAVFFGVGLHLVLLITYLSSSPFASAPLVDSRYYWLVATDTVLAGKPLPGVFFGAPFYPLFLCVSVWLFGPVFWPVYVFQTGLCLATVFLVYRTVLAAFGKSPARWAAVLLLYYAPFAFQSLKLLPDTWGFFFLALFLAVSSATGRSLKMAVLWGFLAGIMVLCRAQLFLPALAIIAFKALWPWSATRLRPGLLTICAMIAALVPFALYTKVHTGRFTPFPPYSGLSLLEGNNPAAAGTYSRVVSDEDRMENRLSDMVKDASKITGQKVKDPFEADRIFRKRAFSFMRNEPEEFLALLCKKAVLMVSPRETFDIYDLYAERRLFLPVLYLFFSGWFLVFPLGLAGAWKIFNEPEARTRAVPFALAVLCLSGILLVFFVNSRYRLLLLPALVPFSGLGADALPLWARGRKTALMSLFGGILALMTLWVLLTNTSPTPSGVLSAGKALAMAGRAGESVALFENLAQENPFSLDLKNSLALLYIWEGRFTKASPLVEELAKSPQFEPRARLYRRLMSEGRRLYGSQGLADVVPSDSFRSFLHGESYEWRTKNP